MAPEPPLRRASNAENDPTSSLLTWLTGEYTTERANPESQTSAAFPA